MRPVLLDLYCGAGGASMGYHRAGFDVIGVDSNLNRKARYPFEFVHTDLAEFSVGDLFDLIRTTGAVALGGSPPCHDNSSLRFRTGKTHGTKWLVPHTRFMFHATGLPWVIENVPGAPLRSPVTLCGSMFGLGAGGRVLKRHREFESNIALSTPPDRCAGQQIGGVYGTGGRGQMTRGYKFTIPEAGEAMGIDWMNGTELSQAIPPAYTTFIGGQLFAALRRGEVAA